MLAMLTAGVSAPARAAEPPLADQPALPGPLSRYRDLPVRRIDGEVGTLGRLLGAPRAAVVSFWATWCAPCALEGRRLAQIRIAYPDERLAIVGLNIDSQADTARLDQFRRQAAMNYTQGIDARAAYMEIARQAQPTLPRTYVFDAGGQPVAAFGRFFGARTLAAIDEAVRQAVAADAPSRLAMGRRPPSWARP